MSTIHPDWHATDDDAVPVRITSKQVTQQPVREISRKPAAIVGMLIVLGIGGIFFSGVQNLRGQLGEDGPGAMQDSSTGDDAMFHDPADVLQTPTPDQLNDMFNTQPDQAQQQPVENRQVPINTGNTQGEVTTGIPRNPYTIGSNRQHPHENPDTSTTATQSRTAVQRFQEGRGPLRQPETGASSWAALLGAIAGVLWVTRKCFAHITE